MRVHDWAKTDLGPPADWPGPLRTAIAICLGSQLPIIIWWGPNLTLLHNDAAAQIVGPHALGESGREVWAGVWSTLGPLIETVFASGIASWSEDVALFVDREVPNQEVYLTFSISPVLNSAGISDGLVCIASETTARVVEDRRLAALREIPTSTATARTVDEAGTAVLALLENDPRDLPFAAIYVADGDSLRLAGTTGIVGALIPPRVGPNDVTSLPLATARHAGHPVETPDDTLDLALPGGPWPEPARKVIVLPLRGPGTETPSGLLVAGISPRRPLDEAYRTWLELLATATGTALADARLRADEHRHARAETALLTNVTRELRTPLALMLGPIDDLLAAEHGELGAAQRRLLELAVRNGQRLDRMIAGLLALAQLDARRAAPAFEPVDLARWTAEIAGLFRTAIEHAGLGCTIDCPTLGEPVYIDRTMWQTIVANLVANAFKHTFYGDITVRLRTEGDRVRLDVVDTGVGIAPEQLPRMFERFHRLDQPARSAAGAGIGLALVGDLVRLHGGEVRVESAPGVGSTFSVFVPHGIAHLAPDAIRSVATPHTQPTNEPLVAEASGWAGLGRFAEPAALRDDPRPRVLIADRDVEAGRYIACALDRDYAMETVADHRIAIALALAAPPDVLITDADHGLDLARALRADPRTAHVAVIARSAPDDTQPIPTALDGVDDCLLALSARELRIRTRAALALSRARRGSAVSVPELRPASSVRHDTRILVVDDHQDSALTLREALVALGYVVEIAFDGPAALEVARRFRPQVALLDLCLPIMDGYELAARLRATHEPPQGLRLVAVTGFGRSTDRQRTAEAGFQDYLVKPVDLAALERIVEDLRA